MGQGVAAEALAGEQHRTAEESGAGAKARNSIGIVLDAGMFLSTLFTLLVVPCIYTLLAGEHKASHSPETSVV